MHATFTDEVLLLEVLNGGVLQTVGCGAGWGACDDVPAFQPLRQPAKVTVTVERVRHQIPGRDSPNSGISKGI